MRFLITGGCGFVGANLIKYLNNIGHTDIIIVDNLSRGSKVNIKDFEINNFFNVDILNLEGSQKIFADVDVVIHLAAYGSVVESVNDPLSNFDINAKGTFNLLNYVRKLDIKKIIFASTGGALIGNANPPVNETSLPKPISPYGASKLSCEAYCSAFANSYNMDITALRFANVVGPFGLHKKGVVNTFINNILEKKPIYIFGDGSSTRDYLHVDDLCDGIFKSSQKSEKGFDVYHLASGRETKIIDMAKLITKELKADGHPIIFKQPRSGEVEKNFANYDLAKKTFAFSPQKTLSEAIKDTYSFLLSKNER